MMKRLWLGLMMAAGCHGAGLSTANPSAQQQGLTPCIADTTCGAGAFCAQYAGDSYCAPDCKTAPCADGRTCISATTQEGQPVSICVPNADVPVGASAGASGGGGAVTGGSAGTGASAGASAGSSAGGSGGASAGSSAGSSAGAAGSGVTATGGTLDVLSFAIVGDTRPAVIEDTKGYPLPIISAIYQDVADAKPAFAIATGDYMYAIPGTATGAAQLDLYLTARKLYAGTVFYTMGNHECDGITFSNCGPDTISGVTTNYKAFQSKLLAEIGQTNPYYRVRIDAVDGSWSAKFLVIAANFWSDTQATWLDTALGEKTTYTFVVRHEGSSAVNGGVSASEKIMLKHDYTALLAGHTHTFSYNPTKREIITGIGGAPLTGSVDYGYVVARQEADGAIRFTVSDYLTKATIQTFRIKADGSPAP